MVLSHAMERAFDAAPDGDGRPGLVVAYFQPRSHFDVERHHDAALAAAGDVARPGPCRHFLERFLGEEDRPADLLLLLVDVDDLKGINGRHGHG